MSIFHTKVEKGRIRIRTWIRIYLKDRIRIRNPDYNPGIAVVSVQSAVKSLHLWLCEFRNPLLSQKLYTQLCTYKVLLAKNIQLYINYAKVDLVTFRSWLYLIVSVFLYVKLLSNRQCLLSSFLKCRFGSIHLFTKYKTLKKTFLFL